MKKIAIIEIPKGSNVKYEINEKTGRVAVDRVLFGSNVYPQNYGYFENTLDWDGDALDGLILSDHSFVPNSEIEVRILGAVKMIDGGETDTKIVTVIDSDPRWAHVQTLEDVPKHLLEEIQDFFENYKNLQKKSVKINGFEGKEYATNEFEVTADLFEKYGDMDKDAFIEKMKQDHPEKYED